MLDVKIAMETADSGTPPMTLTSFSEYISSLQLLSTLREDRSRVEQRATVVEQVLTLSAVNQSSTFTINTALISAMVKEAATIRKELRVIVSMAYIRAVTYLMLILIKEKSIAFHESLIEKGFTKSDGPFVKALDKALASFNVERQAYYSGTFVGNHVHRCLMVRVSCIATYCIIIIMLAHLDQEH